MIRDLKADPYEWQYVHNCIEVQVDNAKEALETFYRGQKLRRKASKVLFCEEKKSELALTCTMIVKTLMFFMKS